MLSPGHIQKRISATAERYGVEVLYACESGSRAWGLGSTDSDYDVRFVYRHSREWYLSLSPDEDQIGPIMEHEGELDLVGWDVRKFLYHIAAGNPGVQEWLGSPIIYQAETDFQLAARQLADDYFRPRRAMLHYLGIARGAKEAGLRDDGTWILKKFFYWLRPILAASYIAKRSMRPPIQLTELLPEVRDGSYTDAIVKLQELKATVAEDHAHRISLALTDYLESLYLNLLDGAQAYPRLTHSMYEADSLFRKTIGWT